MGGGSHNPDSEVDDGPTVPEGSVSGAKTSHGHQRHGQMNHDLGDAYSYMDSTKQHRGHGFERNSHHNDMHPSANPVPTGAQGGRGLGSRGTTDEMHEMGQWHDMNVKDPDRHNGTDLATPREKRAELKAHLRSRSHMTTPKTTREHAEAVVNLMEVEDDVIGLVRGERPNSKPCHRLRERGGTIGLDRNQSRAGGRIHQSTPGNRGSAFPEPRNTRTERKHRGGSGHGSQRPVAEADIPSTTRDLSRLGVESREGAQMPRGIRPSSHYHDFADVAGEDFDYQIRGSHRGHPYPPSDHGHHRSRQPNDGTTRPSHQNYAAVMPEYLPRRSRHNTHLPPAGHGHSGSHACHFRGR